METLSATARLWEALRQSNTSSTFVKLILSKPRDGKMPLKRLIVRPLLIKEKLMWQLKEHYDQKEIVKNHTPADALDLLPKIFDTQFLEANLFLADKHYHLLSNMKGKQKLLVKSFEQETKPLLSHDHQKNRLFHPEGPHWHKLGITDANGNILPSMQHKFKQIHQYIAILKPMLEPLMYFPSLKVVDMGAGKGYLTFALYEFLVKKYPGRLTIKGVEQRSELVVLTNQIAKEANLDGLEFEQGKINSYDAQGTDVLIALHACDTATDDAMAAGIKAGVRLIVCAPCCHKQVRQSITPPDNMPIFKFGILMERQSEILTDTLRALIMEKHGYKSHIQEFIDIGHTPKNLLLTGVKTNKLLDTTLIDQKITALKHQFGIQHQYLETLLTNL